MRNLKRVLSLTLASVMLMGMMVIGAGAAQSTAAGYPDVDKDEHNIEAIDVLQTVQVMIGYTEEEGGGFQPDKNVTRAEMMVIMGKLLNFDYNYYAATCPFTDVPEWARGWVGAAYANKVAVGRGDGIFDPDSPVTAVEASAFLMRALGYFQYSNDYAAGFEAATVLQGNNIGIYKGINSGASEPMTRNQVAKMVLNTLESGMVQPDGNTINLTTPDGSVLTGKVNYVYITSNESYATAISDLQATAMGSNNTGYIVEMGERLYNGDLKLYDGRLDVFGRPSRHWEYDGKSIGTYIKKDLLKQEYTTKVTGKDLYELFGADVIKDYTFEIHIDGETKQAVLDQGSGVIHSQKSTKDYYFFNTESLNRTNTNQVGGTGNGVLTQVFVDGNKKEVYIAIINTYLAKAVADYSENRDEVVFDVYNITEVTDPDNTSYKALVKDSGTNTKDERKEPVTVYGEDFDIKDVKADDIVLVHVAEDEIKEFVTPDVIDETSITAFKTDSYVVTGASGQLNYAHTAMYDVDVLYKYTDTNMKDATYRVYLDPYGYLIGLELLESEKHYVFLTGINSSTENLRDQTAVGNVVFLDGTSQNITINMKDSRNDQNKAFVAPATSNGSASYAYGVRVDTKVTSLMNTWCTYSVDDNGVYTLREVARQDAGTYGFNKTGIGQSHMGGTYTIDGDATGYDYYSTSKNYYDVTQTTSAPNGADTAKSSRKFDKSFPNSYNADEEYVEISKSSVSMLGMLDSAWKRVYGNNDTVYLTAEVEYLTTARNVLSTGNPSTQPAVIITGASSVATGVQDVDMKAMNAQAVMKNLIDGDYYDNANNKLAYVDVSNGAYVLFNDNGYVIAAMVVGGDDGANISYAWVSSNDLSREGLVNGEWEYSRDVIIDGQKVTLTELESNGLAIPDIAQITDTSTGVHNDPINSSGGYVGNRMAYWWEVKTKADGTVKEVNRINYANSSNFNTNDTVNKVRYIYDINQDTRPAGWTSILNQSFHVTSSDKNNTLYRDTSYIPKDTVQIDSDSSIKYKVRVTGNTLQVEGKTGDVRGYAVSENATVVLVKDEKVIRNGVTTGWNYKSEIQYYTNNRNAAGLKQAVNRLGNNEDFVGYISALLVDGRAEWLVIYDKTEAEVDNSTASAVANSYIYAMEPDVNGEYIYVVYNDATGVKSPYASDAGAAQRTPSITEQEDAILAYLNETKDWTNIKISWDRKNSAVTVEYTSKGRASSITWTYYMYSAQWTY